MSTCSAFSPAQYAICLKGIVWREALRFLHQRERFVSALVRPLVTVQGGTGRVELHVDLERAGDEPLVLSAAVGRAAAAEVEVQAGQRTAVVTVTARDVARWWPRGYGEQPRYPVRLVLSTADGRRLDVWERKVYYEAKKAIDSTSG